MKKKVIYLTYEIFRREFDSKILMSILASLRGYHVVVGDLREDIDFNLPQGFYLHKDHGVGADIRFRRWKKNNAYIGALDEEGLITGHPDWYERVRVNKPAIALADYIFLWGDAQSNFFNSAVSPEKFVVSGHPRFDLLTRKNSAVEKVTSILVNTRFTKANPVGTFGHLMDIWKNSGYISNEEEERALKNERDKENKILKEFFGFINSALKYSSELEVTIRCHPVENEEFYVSYFKDEPRVVIDRDTPLFEQFESHDVVLHDGCTTGIEAASLGVPVLGLRPSLESYNYGEFANLFSLNFNTHQSLLNYVFDDFNMTDFHDNDKRVFEEVYGLIRNWKNGGAINAILDTISSLDLEDVDIDRLCSVKEKFVLKKHLLKTWSKYVDSFFGSKVSSLGIKKLQLYLNETKMVEDLSPVFTVNDVKRRIDVISELCNINVKNDDFFVHKLADKSVIISLK